MAVVAAVLASPAFAAAFLPISLAASSCTPIFLAALYAVSYALAAPGVIGGNTVRGLVGLGIVPGNKVEESNQIKIDGEKFREVSLEIQQKWLSKLSDPETYKELQPKIFQPKGKTDLETLIAVSIIGPIGVPMEEALYPQVSTADGEQMNAMYDYVIRMSKDELPPANAFWSLTLYDLEQGFFIPNDYKKYSVGENAGMKLNSEGGIEIFITDQKPDGVSVENWLPIERKNLNLSPQIRVYLPNLEKMKTWQSPTAEKIE